MRVETIVLCARLTLKGATGSRPRVGRVRGTPPFQPQPEQSRRSQRTTSALPAGLPRHIPSSKPDRPQLTTDEFIEVVHY